MSQYENCWTRFLEAKNVLPAVISCQHVADALCSQYVRGLSK